MKRFEKTVLNAVGWPKKFIKRIHSLDENWVTAGKEVAADNKPLARNLDAFFPDLLTTVHDVM